LTPGDVRNKQFSTTRLRPGYEEADVDAFLRRIEEQLRLLLDENECLRRGDAPPPVRQLSPADMRSVVFRTVRLRPGYDEEDVDRFLDEAEAEIRRLIGENDALRAGLAR
jgi:DivIVA domain-containing protein